MTYIEYALYDTDINEIELKQNVELAIINGANCISVPFAYTKQCRTLAKDTPVIISNPIDYPLGLLDTSTRNTAILNAINNIPSVPAPTNNDLSIVLNLFDSSFTYNYVGGNSGILAAGGGNYNADISQASTPIIFRAYWQVEVFTDPNFGGGSVTIDINGTNYASSIALTAGPAPNVLDSNTYGTADVAFYGGMGATGLQFDITCS